MKTEVKEQWIVALRSGEYQQTKGCLRDGEGYCCLGVLTDLWLKDTRQSWQPDTMNRGQFQAPTDEVATLPRELLVWAEMADHNPALKLKSEQWRNASHLNDTGKDFHFIADCIERTEKL